MKRIILIFMLAALLAGCSTSTSTTAPAATDSVMLPEPTACVVSTQPVLYGIWENEKGDVLVFSETSVYMVQADDSSGTPYIRETWYEVQSMDWVNGVATVMMKSVRITVKGPGSTCPCITSKFPSMVPRSCMAWAMRGAGSPRPRRSAHLPGSKTKAL